MKTKSLFYLFIACMLPSVACGMFQPGYAPTQTAVAQTTVAASWTATPTSTPTQTFTPTPTETQTPTPTPDPCLPENLPEAVKEINDLQVQFDDLSGIAAGTEREQLPDKIAELQDLLQIAREQDTPPCLETLREHQVKHMELVIETLQAFLAGADKQTIDGMIQHARDKHDEFLLEAARLLGITLTP